MLWAQPVLEEGGFQNGRERAPGLGHSEPGTGATSVFAVT